MWVTNTTGIMLEILNNYPWTKLSVRIIGVKKRQLFHMVTHVFDNSNLSHEIFAIDTWRAVSTWSQTYAYDPSDYKETRLNFPDSHRTN